MSPTARLFRTLVLSLAATILVFVGVGYLLVDRWEVDSVRVVTAEMERVEPLLRDFGAWQQWSGMTVELGAGMEHKVTGKPGQVGHRVVWSGAKGDAILRMQKVSAGRIDYEFLSRRTEDLEPTVVARGHIAYRQEGTGTRVEWHDEGQLRNLIERWIGWFGSLQEQVRTIQGVSLAGLQKALDKSSGDQKRDE